MKKLGIFAMSLAMAAFTLSSCGDKKKGGSGDLDNVVEDGFYVYGPATAIENMQAANAAKGLMGAGINEADKQARAGLYEKYVALEGGKEFTLALYENNEVTNYGAKLELGDPYDVAYGVTIKVYKGKLEQNVKMTVPENGFYHYKTNPAMFSDWIIAGEMKLIRILSDEEVALICRENGEESQPRMPD